MKLRNLLPDDWLEQLTLLSEAGVEIN